MKLNITLYFLFLEYIALSMVSLLFPSHLKHLLSVDKVTKLVFWYIVSGYFQN